MWWSWDEFFHCSCVIDTKPFRCRDLWPLIKHWADLLYWNFRICLYILQKHLQWKNCPPVCFWVWLILFLLFLRHLSSVAVSPGSQRNPVASIHSIANATTPDRLRFPRGTASRSTFHGGQLRDRRTATYNGPPASPTLSHDATPLSQTRSRGTSNLFSKLTSKLTRR